MESSITAYWVVPPPESKPNEYGRPMMMTYNVSYDNSAPEHVRKEIQKCVEYYSKESDYINFNDKFYASSTFGDKLKASLSSKLPRENSENSMWNFIRELIGLPVTEDKESVLSIPSISKSSPMMMNFTPPSSLASSLMFPSDIASVLFNSGKFPSTSSLLGLPDPMAHSTLAANNLFLQSNIFKMQDLLKPLSTSSPISCKSKSESKSSPTLKIPSELKSSPKVDFPTDLNILALKHKLEYPSPDLNLSKYPKTDFSMSDMSSISSHLMSLTKDYSVSDLSTSGLKSKSDFSLNLSKNASSDNLERPSKIPKADYSLDLSTKSSGSSFQNVPNDLSISQEVPTNLSESKDDQPLNLHADNN